MKNKSLKTIGCVFSWLMFQWQIIRDQKQSKHYFYTKSKPKKRKKKKRNSSFTNYIQNEKWKKISDQFFGRNRAAVCMFLFVFFSIEDQSMYVWIDFELNGKKIKWWCNAKAGGLICVCVFTQFGRQKKIFCLFGYLKNKIYMNKTGNQTQTKHTHTHT